MEMDGILIRWQDGLQKGYHVVVLYNQGPYERVSLDIATSTSFHICKICQKHSGHVIYRCINRCQELPSLVDPVV